MGEGPWNTDPGKGRPGPDARSDWRAPGRSGARPEACAAWAGEQGRATGQPQAAGPEHGDSGPDLPQDRASSAETWGAAARPDRRGAAHRGGRRGTCLSGRSRATEEPRGSGQASQQEASLSRRLPERHPCSRGRAEDAHGGGSAKRLRSSVAARGRGRAGAPRSVSLGVGPRRGSSC